MGRLTKEETHFVHIQELPRSFLIAGKERLNFLAFKYGGSAENQAIVGKKQVGEPWAFFANGDSADMTHSFYLI